MRVVVQRAKDASCVVDNKLISHIDYGFMLLVGFTEGDDLAVLEKVAKKVQGLRILPDSDGKMNQSLHNVNGEILSISQFTLYGDVSNGYRPGFSDALGGDKAKPLYLKFNEILRGSGLRVSEGIFGADMNISFTNMGPTTILIDSNNL